jgi:hypothetical protein
MPAASRTALVAAVAIGLCCPAAATADVFEALAGGEVGLDFRHRIELVDEDGFSEDAEASTLRTRLNYQSGSWNGLDFFVEFSDVRAIGLDDYNAGAGATPDKTDFPVVADPEDTRVNQAWIGLQPGDALTVRLGRQRIKLDNDRFVGNVGWRQNEQTYDGGSIAWRQGHASLFYSYVTHANRIFDSEVSAGDNGHDTHLLNAGFDVADGHRLGAYLYDIDDEDIPAFGTRTFGLRYEGSTALGGDRTVDWLAEFARQSDAGDNPVDYDANYYHARAALSLTPVFEPVAGFERLEGNDRPGAAFRTPLATLHAFNGWADRFLVTPDGGLDDLYVGFSGGRERIGYSLTWHRFETETGGTELGTEIDGSVSVALADGLSLLVKAAHFDDEDPSVRGVTKFWTMLSFRL